MSAERFLVTGANGCIGAWTLRALVEEGVPVVALDLDVEHPRPRLVLDAAALEQVQFVRGDVTERASLDAVLAEHAITHVVHLAGLQLPYCRAEPELGARVNVVGTVNVFESAAAVGVSGLVYASSIAVYGTSLYGTWKSANEGTARTYWADRGFASIGLRPSLVYGVGRDRGVTSAATYAMLAAALGRPYRMAHGGRMQFQHARDVAGLFVRAARAATDGAPVYDLGGGAHEMADLVDTLARIVPESAGTISFVDEPFGGGDERSGAELEAALGPVAWTPFDAGVRETVERFRELAAEGRVSPADLG
jgi:UDP-glucuronate 4-epimerase